MKVTHFGVLVALVFSLHSWSASSDLDACNTTFYQSCFSNYVFQPNWQFPTPFGWLNCADCATRLSSTTATLPVKYGQFTVSFSSAGCSPTGQVLQTFNFTDAELSAAVKVSPFLTFKSSVGTNFASGDLSFLIGAQRSTSGGINWGVSSSFSRTSAGESHCDSITGICESGSGSGSVTYNPSTGQFDAVTTVTAWKKRGCCTFNASGTAHVLQSIGGGVQYGPYSATAGYNPQERSTNMMFNVDASDLWNAMKAKMP